VITIPFVKAHGAQNDFLLTWSEGLAFVSDFASAAIAICHRNTGAGADGWILVSSTADAGARIELYNSDGGRSAISGNGTRCAAAMLLESGRIVGPEVRILTGAGAKHLRVLESKGLAYSFEMNMGSARMQELHSAIVPGRDATILDVGNPQCAVFVQDFDFDWRALGAQLERHPRFPERTNVSFVQVVDRHTLEVRFFERGAGATMSSGTGSTGAGAAALARGFVESPVRVITPAGPLELRWHGEDIFLCGPAEIVARGEFYWKHT
jgi:diaminopimelate epimerase